MSVLTRPPIVTNGLVLHLDAANRKSYPGSGTTWFDMSGNSVNGTLTNGPFWNQQQGGAVAFDGVNDYVLTSGISALFVEFTIGAWMYVSESQPNDFATIVYSRTTSPAATGFHFLGSAYGGDGYKLSYTYNGSGYSTSQTVSVTPLAWTYAVLMFKSNAANFYINGSFRSSTSQTLTSVALSSLNIARDSSTFPRYFKGSISQIQIYNRALTDQEVLQNYNATKARFGL